MPDLVDGPDGKPRCGWCATTADFFPYHDNEWGYPVDDDRQLFEKLCLESFQSGLSWRTILAKREHFRQAFHHFDFDKIALFSAQDVERLLQDAGIVRHRGKIEAVINNAARAIELIEQEGSLARYIWRFEPARSCVYDPLRARSDESVALSRDLKKRGWKFVGPTTVYAFMQAMGLVNDHHRNCITYARVEAARQKFRRP